MYTLNIAPSICFNGNLFDFVQVSTLTHNLVVVEIFSVFYSRIVIGTPTPRTVVVVVPGVIRREVPGISLSLILAVLLLNTLVEGQEEQC